MLPPVSRVTVNLPDDLHARLREVAAEHELPVAAVVRAAIHAFLVPRGNRGLAAAGAGASGETDLSERIKEILHRESGDR